MRIHLWSYNYAPEPTGIAPLSRVAAEELQGRGHDVTVLAAHPHYPAPIWGRAIRPYRERRNGVRVLRFPLWIGRKSTSARIRQEVTFTASVGLGAMVAGRPDVILAVSPSFPALSAAMVHARLRRVPWVMWLQDILPDGAATTGLVESNSVLSIARRFERFSYDDAAKVVVISAGFSRNLEAKGVPAAKLVRVNNPSAIAIPDAVPALPARSPARLLVMGNIGFSQGLAEFVRAIQHSSVLERGEAELRIAGQGVAFDDVRAAIDSSHVEMLGLLFGTAMEDELWSATLGVVTQTANVEEFNLPSKLMNYMAHGRPVLACVRSNSETARFVNDSGGGWVVDSADLSSLPTMLEQILADPIELQRRATAAHRFAGENFNPRGTAERLETVLQDAVTTGRQSHGRIWAG